MLVSSFVGIFSHVGRRLKCAPALLATPLIFLLFAPSAFSQNPSNAPKPPQDAQKLQTTRQANDRIAQLALAASAKQGDYIIGSGDLLGIEVFDVPELSREVRVNESGFISIPLLPVKVQASGLTTFQLQDKLTELLRANGLVTNAQVTITLREQHSEPITITGAVKTPIVIHPVHQTTLLEALSQAGGIADDAGSQVLITRAPQPIDTKDPAASKDPATAESLAAGPTITIDLDELLNTGDPMYNIPLLGGDVVSVPRAGLVYAVGAVQHAGGFIMQSDRQQMTVLKVLSLSGGLQPTARPRDAVIIRRDPITGDQKQVPVNIRKILELKSEDVRLQASDILFVPDSASKHAWREAGRVAVSMATGVAVIRAGQ